MAAIVITVAVITRPAGTGQARLSRMIHVHLTEFRTVPSKLPAHIEIMQQTSERLIFALARNHSPSTNET
jgi:hypothetical protein